MTAPGKTKIPRVQAIAVAKALCALLQPCCERLIVAGSLRRRKSEVDDVEILYVPKFSTERDGLFDTNQINLADRALEKALADRELNKRPNIAGALTWGPKNKLALWWHVPVDLFQATPENWFNLLVCRTGSAENNIRISTAAQNRRWKWHPYGEGFTDEYGALRRVESEADVFDFVGLPYREPWER